MKSDNEDYWIERHRKYVGDVRSVGNTGKDIATNLAGYDLKIRMLEKALLASGLTINELRILEVGCGIGMMAPALINAGATYTGLDISPQALEQARMRAPGGSFLQCNAYEYQLEERFDVVFCTDVLLHLIIDENWFKALANMRNHLVPGGTILIKEEIYQERRAPVPHVVSRSRLEYLTACQELGLEFQPIADVNRFYAIKTA